MMTLNISFSKTFRIVSRELEIRPNHVLDVVQQPDKMQELRYKSIRVNMYSKKVTSKKKTFFILVSAIPVTNGLLIEGAMRIYPLQGSSLDDKTPLELLQFLGSKFGCKIKVGNRSGKYICYESIALDSFPQNLLSIVRIIDRKDRTEFATVNYSEITDENGPVFHCLFLSFIDKNRYLKYHHSRGYPPDITGESELIEVYAREIITPKIANKTFENGVYLLLHDFCFYCRERPKALYQFEESNIRDLFLVAAKTALRTGEAEAYHYDGKLDFKLINPGNRYEIMTGEFKWWRGVGSAIDVFHQAIRKHTTGQEQAIFTIMISKAKDSRKIFSKILAVYKSQPETKLHSYMPIVPAGSKELFGMFKVQVRNSTINLYLGLIDLFYEQR